MNSIKNPGAADRSPVGPRPRVALSWAASLAVAAGAGWFARGPAPAPAAATALPAAAPVAAAPGAPRTVEPTLIAVAGDGRVTLRVEQQPLDWVLEQIALQSGRSELRPARPIPASMPPAADAVEAVDPVEAAVCPPPFLPADPARLLYTIEHGADAERADALLRARSDGIAVPEPLLKTLLETAASERVRLAALENWLELRAGDPKAERAALESALLVSSAAVQQEARQRLDDLDGMERLDALSAQGGSSP